MCRHGGIVFGLTRRLSREVPWWRTTMSHTSNTMHTLASSTLLASMHIRNPFIFAFRSYVNRQNVDELVLLYY